MKSTKKSKCKISRYTLILKSLFKRTYLNIWQTLKVKFKYWLKLTNKSNMGLILILLKNFSRIITFNMMKVKRYSIEFLDKLKKNIIKNWVNFSSLSRAIKKGCKNLKFSLMSMNLCTFVTSQITKLI